MLPPASDQESSQKYVTLANHLRSQIEAGAIRPGDRLPSLVELRQLHGASQATAERAYALLEREGFILRRPKRGLFLADWRQARRQDVLGVAIPKRLHGHAYYERIVRGIQSVAHEEGLEVLFLNEGSPTRWEKVDGVLLLTSSRAAFEALPTSMPAVALLRPLRNGTSVVSDDLTAIRQSVEHLLELGHRRIGFITGGLVPFPEEDIFYPNVTGQHRLTGYYEAMRAAGIEPDPSWIRPVRNFSEPMTTFEELGRIGMQQWLRQGWRDLGCTALLAHNDETAVAMIEVLQEAGYRVPEDVSVIGFDGLDIATYFRPRLTTVQVPLEEMGARGATLLLEQIRLPLSALQNSARGQQSPTMVVLSSQLKIGASSGPCPVS